MHDQLKTFELKECLNFLMIEKELLYKNGPKTVRFAMEGNCCFSV